jgi:FMNH2-dependent dimethyl sulfone monooxygenase
VNVVSGWFKGEFTALGEPWLEHDERYRRSEEFITALKRIWTEDHAELAGDFYRIRDFSLKPKPLQDPHPTIFQGGNSTAAREMAARVSDVYFMNGNTLSGVEYQVTEVRQRASTHDRDIGFALNGFMVARDSEAEAQRVVHDIVEQANEPAVEGFRDAVQQAGKSTADGTGMWQDSTFADLVQYNDGFRTGLVGTPEQVARRILEYKARGVDIMLLGFLHFQEEVEYFGAKVLPIVRELEREQGVEFPAHLNERVAS